jgi:hypothetical protein
MRGGGVEGGGSVLIRCRFWENPYFNLLIRTLK